MCSTPERPSRIVTVSSAAHYFGHINFDDLQSQRNYDSWRAYGQSKLANVLFSYELARRLPVGANCTGEWQGLVGRPAGRGLCWLQERQLGCCGRTTSTRGTFAPPCRMPCHQRLCDCVPMHAANTLHPGVVDTELARYLLPGQTAWWQKPLLQFGKAFSLTPEQGAQVGGGSAWLGACLPAAIVHLLGMHCRAWAGPIPSHNHALDVPAHLPPCPVLNGTVHCIAHTADLHLPGLLPRGGGRDWKVLQQVPPRDQQQRVVRCDSGGAAVGRQCRASGAVRRLPTHLTPATCAPATGSCRSCVPARL